MALFNDSLFIEWYSNSISVVAEQHTVINGRCVLNYIPDKFVGITCLKNGTTPIYYIKENQPLTTSTQFSVDWSTGFITFYSNSADNATVTFNYSKKGLVLYPVDRLYKSLSEDGLTVTETLQDYMDTVDSYTNLGIYNPATTYSHHNIVLYNNSSFISTSQSDITGITPTNSAYWKPLTQGVYDRGTYDNSTQYYVGDMVWYDSTKSKYIVHTKPSIATIPTNSSYWTKVMDFASIYTEISQMTHLGIYNPLTQYVKHNQVQYQGSSYVMTSDTPVTGVLPTVTASWNLVSSRGSDLSFKGAYSGSESYLPNDLVSYQSQSYVCILASANNAPTNNTYWSLFSMNNVSALRSVVVLGSDTNTFNINISSYDLSVDVLEIYQNNTHLHPTTDYSINQYTQGRIDKPSGTWSSGTSFSIIVYKNFNNLITFNSGTVLEDGSISLAKLDQSTQDAITANVTRVRSYNGSVTIAFANATNTLNVGAYVNQYDNATDDLDVYLNSTFLSPTLYTKVGNNIVLNSGVFGGLTEGDSDFIDFVVKKSMTDVPLATFSGSLITNGTINNSAYASIPLQNLAALNSTAGLVTQTGTNTFTKRSIASANTKLTVTNADGVSGNPTLTVNEDNLNFAHGLIQSQISTPTTPSASYTKTYPKSDGRIYKLNPSGHESCIEYGISTKEIGLIGDGIANDATKLNTWITSIGSTKVDLIVTNGTYLISTNVTFPSNVNIIFMHGGIFKVSNTFSITGTNTKLECGLWQCFDLSLGGTVVGSWDIKEAYSQWFGAVGDGTNDDTIAIQNTINFIGSNGGVIYFATGTYLVSMINLLSNIKILGQDRNQTVIKRISTFSTDNYGDYHRRSAILNAFTAGTTEGTFSNITIENLTIDGNRQNITIVSITKLQNSGASNIKIKLTDNVKINNVVSKNSLKDGITCDGCTNITIKESECCYNGIDQFPGEILAKNGISLNGEWYSDETASAVSVDKSLYTIDKCYLHHNTDEGIAFAYTRAINIINNEICFNGDRAIEGDSAFVGGEYFNVTVDNNYIHDNTRSAITFSNSPTVQNLIITNNKIVNHGLFAIYVSSASLVTNTNNIIISKNIIDGTGQEVGVDTSTTHSIYIQGSKIKILNNICKNLKLNAISCQKAISLDINGNYFSTDEERALTAISLTIFNNAIPVDNINIENNIVYGYLTRSIVITSDVDVRNMKIINNCNQNMGEFFRNFAPIDKLTVNNNYCTDLKAVKTFGNMLHLTSGTVGILEYFNNVNNNALYQDINTKNTITTLLEGNNSTSKAHKPASSNAAPSGGDYIVGEIVYNSTPTAGGYLGWVCITSGAPGTWKGFGLIQA